MVKKYRSSQLGSGIGKGKEALERGTDMDADDRMFLTNMRRLIKEEVTGSTVPAADRRRWERLMGSVLVDYDDPSDEVYFIPNQTPGKKELGKKRGMWGISRSHGGPVKKYAKGGSIRNKKRRRTKPKGIGIALRGYGRAMK